jgi:predicted Zn-dependent peptidase
MSFAKCADGFEFLTRHSFKLQMDMKYINQYTYLLLLSGLLMLSNCTPKMGDQVSAPKPDMPKPAADFRSEAPVAGPARKIEIGDYETFVLDNGLRVIVVENHKIPRISYRLFVDRDPVVEGEISGMTGIAGQMLSRGTTTRTKSQIDESIDFVGGSMNTNAQGGFVSSLTRHNETVLSIFADVIQNPSFPDEEFMKLKKQTLSGLQTEKDDPNAISSNVSNALLFGKDHPYGEITSEVTVESITLNDCKKYYEQYFKPNISYLVVVGDIASKSAKAQAAKYFGTWSKGEVAPKTYKQPTAPAKTSVSFVDKTGAVQSVINIAYPVNLKPGTPDVIPARVMNTILGSGFSGRLFLNLREDKAYTYGAYSSLDADEVIGEFSASASVRNEVTDSAVTQFMIELNKLRNEEVTDSELELAKNYIAGAFARSLENPQTVAGFALNTYRYKLPADYYATYLEQLEKVSKADILAMAKKYIKPDQANIIVVGNQDAVAEKLSVFDAEDGKIAYYDIYANKKADPGPIEINVTGKEVIKTYLKAIGGEEKLKTVKAMSLESSMEVQGMGNMTVQIYQMAPGKFSMTMGMPGMTVMKQVFDGKAGYVEQMGQKQMLEGEMLSRMKHEAQMFPETGYLTDAYQLEVKGIEEIGGEQAYKLLVSGENGVSTEYYGVVSGYKLKSVVSQDVGGGQVQSVITEYSDYKEVSGLTLPHLARVTGMAPFPLEMKTEKIEVNATIDPAVFDVQ